MRNERPQLFKPLWVWKSLTYITKYVIALKMGKHKPIWTSVTQKENLYGLLGKWIYQMQTLKHISLGLWKAIWNLEMSQPKDEPIDWEWLRGKIKSVCALEDITELFSQPNL